MTFTLRSCLWGGLLFVGFASLAIILGGYMFYDMNHRGGKRDTCTEEYECNHRLSSDVVPIEYKILLHPNLDEGTFTGTVTIKVETLSPQNNIFFHSKGLSVNKTEIVPEASMQPSLGISKSFEYPKNEFWVIKPAAKIPAGKYSINLDFSGKLTGKIIGFYRSVYTDKISGKQVPIATSKFEPTFARQAFPCFDEPSFKAKFAIKLVRPSDKNYIALSNMNQVGEESDKPATGLTTVSFAESVPMSTYLACFIVCDFKHYSPSDKTNGATPAKISKSSAVPITAYARPGQELHMEYAHFIGVHAIEYYVKYFNIDYPLPKLDLIGIPDFVSGAMEHWGLVTFRETSVLYTPNESSLANKKRIALTVAHELAHMWFGNLVTMKWWNDLWLNEGFASYMEFKAVNSIHPDWDIDTQFLAEDMFGVLDLDCQFSSHPIVQNVSNPDQITEIFDFISYSKGSAIIRMLEAFMGEHPFQQGVSSYLTSYKFNNAETKDLWNHLQKYAGDVNIAQIMATWTNQMGYPLVTVSRDGNKVTFSQKRFLPDNSQATAETAKSKNLANSMWDIPIMYYTSSDPKTKMVWLPQNKSSTTIDVDSGTTWVKVNFRNFGYYRVNYDDSAWDLFGSTLNSNPNILTAADRANLLNDAFSLAKANLLSYAVPLNLSKYMKSEKSSVPISVILDKFKDLKDLLRNTPIYEDFLAFGRKSIVLPQDVWEFQETTSFAEGDFKSTLLNLACLLEIPECTQTASKIFLSWLLNNGSKPAPDLRSLVYNTGMKTNSTMEIWSKLWEKYLDETTPSEKLKLMVALTTARNKQILEKFIEYAKNESYVRSQDYFIVMNLIGKNPVGTELVWDFMRNEWPYLVDRFTLNDRSFGRLIPGVCSSFTTADKLKEMKDFFAKYPEAGAGAAGRARALETVSNNIQWLATNYKPISDFLVQQKN